MAAVTIMAASLPAQAQWARPNGERSPPPTELSIALPASQVATLPNVQPPKPVVRNIIVRRPRSIQSGPVNMPAADVLVMMVRAALTAVNQANFTENYSVLRGMTTPALQTRLSAEQLGRAFVDLRKQNLDLSPALVLAPEFTEMPRLTSAGALILKGIFPSRPLRINFAIEYLPIDGFWMIDQLSVSASRADAPLPAQVAAPQVTGPQETAPRVAAPEAAQATPAVTVPAPAPVVQDTKPAAPDRAQTSLATGRFVPVNFSLDYKPAFIPAVRQASPKPRAMPAAAPAREGPLAYLQLTSQRTEAEAKAVFNSLRVKYAAILGDRQAVIRRADLGDKGIYYRAQIGPVNAAEAAKQCSDLRSVGGQCFVQYN
ncbi:MAG: SPOR domain-containing protein [Pseudolabrys sp.]|nr:SPOR domain-containing protein [Pseudolabrys sp.]